MGPGRGQKKGVLLSVEYLLQEFTFRKPFLTVNPAYFMTMPPSQREGKVSSSASRCLVLLWHKGHWEGSTMPPIVLDGVAYHSFQLGLCAAWPHDKDPGILFWYLSNDRIWWEVILILKIINYTICLLVSYNLVFGFMVTLEISLTENNISALWRHAVILRGHMFWRTAHTLWKPGQQSRSF